MDSELRTGGVLFSNSMLLELAASGDVLAFKTEVEERGCDVGKAELWYGRRIGSKKMGFEKRTPLMIASMFGNTDVVKYIIGMTKCNVNHVCGSDKATALHLAVAGGSEASVEVVKLLLAASAEPVSVDSYGNRPVDLIPPPFRLNCLARRKGMEMLLQGHSEAIEMSSDSDGEVKSNSGSKKEYPVDIALPDINNAMFTSDDFRMFTFKVKLCSRAYSHDWTECPFVHPGENARRRDPHKYPYSCVPCPEFRKGSCQKGDSCEYAHGVFESWLHPAQYRTRLCKDETGCARKVCFFAHRPEELRPVYASTGSAIPSPKSYSTTSLDLAPITPLSLGSPSMAMATISAPPMSPLAGSSSPLNWQNKVKLSPPALQLSGRRLKTALSARDLNMELMEEISRVSSPTYFHRSSETNNLKDHFGSPTRCHIRPNMSQFRSSYPISNIPSSPVRKFAASGFDSSSAVAAAVMNSRSSAMTKRSQSFIDRGVCSPIRPSSLDQWGSPYGKLDWGAQGDELNKFRRSSSFGVRSNHGSNTSTTNAVICGPRLEDPDVSWVNSLVKDANDHVPMYSPWVDQLCREPEQMAA